MPPSGVPARSALRRLSAWPTTLTLSRRLSTVADADQILALEQGRHHQLLACGGRYTQM